MNPADLGRAAILQFDVASGTLRGRYELPRDGTAHEPGDIAVAPNGDLFVSDGRAGVIYVIREGSTSLDTLVRAGPLASPQGWRQTATGRACSSPTTRSASLP